MHFFVRFIKLCVRMFRFYKSHSLRNWAHVQKTDFHSWAFYRTHNQWNWLTTMLYYLYSISPYISISILLCHPKLCLQNHVYAQSKIHCTSYFYKYQFMCGQIAYAWFLLLHIVYTIHLSSGVFVDILPRQAVKKYKSWWLTDSEQGEEMLLAENKL